MAIDKLCGLRIKILSMKKVKLFLNYAGFCYAKESHAIKGGAPKAIKFQALFGLIEHPEKGWILYDTAYTTRFHEVTKNYPNKIYAQLTKVVIEPENEVKSQLRHFGIEADDIKHIIITHFHADHVAGLKDFKNATIYCSRVAFSQLKSISNFWAFSKGILKTLIPDDFDSRVQLIEEMAEKKPDSLFNRKYDLFGDDSIYLYELPGHAAGQIGVRVETEKQNYFLIADACWLKISYKELLLPPPIVKLFFDSWKDFKESLQKVHNFHLQHPEVVIVPTHCSESTDPLVSSNYDINAL